MLRDPGAKAEPERKPQQGTDRACGDYSRQDPPSGFVFSQKRPAVAPQAASVDWPIVSRIHYQGSDGGGEVDEPQQNKKFQEKHHFRVPGKFVVKRTGPRPADRYDNYAGRSIIYTEVALP